MIVYGYLVSFEVLHTNKEYKRKYISLKEHYNFLIILTNSKYINVVAKIYNSNRIIRFNRLTYQYNLINTKQFIFHTQETPSKSFLRSNSSKVVVNMKCVSYICENLLNVVQDKHDYDLLTTSSCYGNELSSLTHSQLYVIWCVKGIAE